MNLKKFLLCNKLGVDKRKSSRKDIVFMLTIFLKSEIVERLMYREVEINFSKWNNSFESQHEVLRSADDSLTNNSSNKISIWDLEY
jgi:hypothetical protein